MYEGKNPTYLLRMLSFYKYSMVSQDSWQSKKHTTWMWWKKIQMDRTCSKNKLPAERSHRGNTKRRQKMRKEKDSTAVWLQRKKEHRLLREKAEDRPNGNRTRAVGRWRRGTKPPTPTFRFYVYPTSALTAPFMIHKPEAVGYLQGFRIFFKLALDSAIT